MQAIIGSTLLSSKVAQPTKKPFEIYDIRLPGFTLRVQPSGVRSYYARFGRNRRIALGKADTLEPDEARERCQKVLGNVAHGRHPLHGLGGTDGIILGVFIADTYTTWVSARRPRTAADTLEKLYRHFRTWYPEPLTAITVERVEAWKARRLSEGRSGSTVLRDLFTLSSVLRRAVTTGELTENPVRRVDKPRIDRRGKARFLDQAEESRLRDALKARDEEMQNRRTVANNRRQTRHERVLPPLMHFGDHLTPAVLLSMNWDCGAARSSSCVGGSWTSAVGFSPSRAGLRRIARPGMCRSMRKPRACCGAGANSPELECASLMSPPDFGRRGKKSSSEPRSAISAGTTSAITLLRAWFSTAFR